MYFSHNSVWDKKKKKEILKIKYIIKTKNIKIKYWLLLRKIILIKNIDLRNSWQYNERQYFYYNCI